MWNQLFTKLPEDSIFIAEAHGSDERQRYRLNAYKNWVLFLKKEETSRWVME